MLISLILFKTYLNNLKPKTIENIDFFFFQKNTGQYFFEKIEFNTTKTKFMPAPGKNFVRKWIMLLGTRKINSF